MSRGKYIVGALVGSAVVAYVCDKVISDDKIFGGKFLYSDITKTKKLLSLAANGFVFFFSFKNTQVLHLEL